MDRRVIGLSRYLILASVSLGSAAASAKQEGSAQSPTCQVAEDALVRVPELREGSGLAASARLPGRFWAHNDSGEPVLLALDAKGKVVGRMQVSGATVEDWEAVAVGPCPAGSCIYVGDVGDNDAARREITIYRVPEPADVAGGAAKAEAIRVRYPDGSHDAEALLVTPKGQILIVTKGDTGPVGLYRLPSDVKAGATVTLQAVGKPRDSGKPSADDRITDGAVSPSGSFVALRTKTAIVLYRTADLLAGSWREASRVSLKALGEPQGEGIAFGDERTLYLVGEGGGKSQPGTFGRVTCTW